MWRRPGSCDSHANQSYEPDESYKPGNPYQSEGSTDHDRSYEHDESYEPEDSSKHDESVKSDQCYESCEPGRQIVSIDAVKTRKTPCCATASRTSAWCGDAIGRC